MLDERLKPAIQSQAEQAEPDNSNEHAFYVELRTSLHDQVAQAASRPKLNRPGFPGDRFS
jgi:hypothetical protein